MFSFTGQLSVSDGQDQKDSVAIVIAISKATDGFVAETTRDRIKYVSEAVDMSFLGDVDREVFADVHEKFPPELGSTGDVIWLKYRISIMRRELAFNMKKVALTDREEMMIAYERTRDEVKLLRQEVERLRLIADKRPAGFVQIIGTRDGKIHFRSTDAAVKAYLMRVLQLTYHGDIYGMGWVDVHWSTAYRTVEDLFIRHEELGCLRGPRGRSWPSIFNKLRDAFSGCPGMRYNQYVECIKEGANKEGANPDRKSVV